MQNQGSGPLAEGAVSKWSQILGMSVRPWSGEAPVSLIIRGAIQLAVCVLFLWVALQMMNGGDIAGSGEELKMLRGVAFLIFAGVVIPSALGALGIIVGILDLVPRHSVTGTVVSLRNRRFLDFLPAIVQRQIFARGNVGMDNRKTRTEVVLETQSGRKQWTVRKLRTQRELEVGAHVRLTVTPIAGYVASVEQLTYGR